MPTRYRDVDLPANWDQFDRDGKVNYLVGAMGRETLVNLVRERCLNNTERDAVTFDKGEVAELFLYAQQAQEESDDV